MAAKDPGVGLLIRDMGSRGRGVVASRRFVEHDTVLEFAGPLLATEDVHDFTFTIQVDTGLFLGPSGGIDDYVNHSCDPNCSVRWGRRRPVLTALRDIEVGTEITFDYSTCMLEEPAIEACLCGAPRCRGRIAPFCEVDPETRARYLRLGIVPDFVRRAVGASARPSPVMRRRPPPRR